MKNLLNFNTLCKLNGARLSLAPFLILLYLLPVQLLSQQSFNYFNKRIDLTGSYDKGLTVLNTENGYSVGTITQDTVYHYYWQIAFALTDTMGELYQIKQYGDSGDNYMLGNPGSLIKYSDSKNYAVGNIMTFLPDNQVNNRALIMCLDTNYDTLWTKRFTETVMPYDTQSVIFQIKKCTDNTLINTGVVMGNTYVKNTPSRIWLLKTDSLGNKLWEQFYGEGEEYFQGHSVVQTNDGGYVIGAAKFEIHATGGYLDPIIIKTDSLGNEEWRINPGNPNVDDNKVMVSLAPDGNIIAGTNYGTEQSGDNRWAVVKILKITPEGNVLWDYNYLEPQYDNFLLNTVILSNGDILSNGSYTIFSNGSSSILSWILCLDSLGNNKWYKEYKLLTGQRSFNDLYDVRETPDGGLIGCGMVYPVVPDTGTADIWLMQMDSMGCLFAGCDTTVIVEETAGLQEGFKLYPNPAQNLVTCELNNITEKETVFSIYNTLGIKAKEVIVPAGSKKISVSISTFHNGVYLAVLTANGKHAGTRKFVVKK